MFSNDKDYEIMRLKLLGQQVKDAHSLVYPWTRKEEVYLDPSCLCQRLGFRYMPGPRFMGQGMDRPHMIQHIPSNSCFPGSKHTSWAPQFPGRPLAVFSGKSRCGYRWDDSNAQ